MSALPQITTPEELARHFGWSERRVRKLARNIGACRIMGNRMTFTPDDVKAMAVSQGLEACLLTMPTQPKPEPAPPPRRAPPQGYIYVVACGEFVKIGYTTNPRGRLSSLRVSTPFEITVLQSFEGTLENEQALHQRFAAYRTQGEWFRHEGEVAAWIEAGYP